MLAPITKRQKQVFDFIKKYIDRYGYSPTLNEIKKALNLSAVSTVHQHIEVLINKGYINRSDNMARAIEINKDDNLIEIPLVGTITAGKPIEAIEVHGETVSVSMKDINLNNKYFALKVKGESMIEEGIYDGDIVVIKKQSTAENGQTVVAIIDDNQVTLKKIYRERDSFRLQPANQSMLPFYKKEVEIKGVVIKTIRNFCPNI